MRGTTFAQYLARNVSRKFREWGTVPVGTKTLNPGYEHLLSPAHFVNEYKLSTKLLQGINTSAAVADTQREPVLLILVFDPDVIVLGKDILFIVFCFCMCRFLCSLKLFSK